MAAARGVGGQNGIFRCMGIHISENAQFQINILGSRLNHELCGSHTGFQVGLRDDPAECILFVLFGECTLGHLPVKVFADGSEGLY